MNQFAVRREGLYEIRKVSERKGYHRGFWLGYLAGGCTVLGLVLILRFVLGGL
jgi:hypothetical protein